MATAAPAKAPSKAITALSPTEVEKLAAEYRALEAKIDGIFEKATAEAAPLRTRRDEIWDLLVAQVRKFGSQHEKKSKLLHGLALEVMGTFASSSSIDGAAVEVFRLALVKAKQSRVLKRIFEKTIRWTLRPEAGALLRADQDAGTFPDELFVLYARCSVARELSPKLVVRDRQAVA